jgi:predicted MPP superfamily phosphohydrolase
MVRGSAGGSAPPARVFDPTRMTRLLIFLAVALVIFAPLNWLAWRSLTRIHPRRRKLVLAAIVLGNAMWALLPAMRTFTPLTRALRAVLAPLWFGWTSFALLYAIFLLLLVIVWLPFRTRPFPEFARRPSTVLLATLAIGFVAGWFQAVVPLRVERVQLEVPSLPQEAVGTRFALMGDLHVGLFTRASRLERIMKTVASLEPHAALIAGDLIDDDPHFVPKLLAGASHLPDGIPLFAVLGNHEIYGDPTKVIRALHGSRIRMLLNEGVGFRGVWLAGVTDRAALQQNLPALKPDLVRALASRPDAMPVVLVSHQPSIIDEARTRGVAVQLSAHTHGGQLGIRPLGLSLAGVFLRHHMGLYDLAPTQLYINTGTGYWVFPFRLGMTPEITLVELVRGPA